MLSANNPAVNLETRRRLRALLRSDSIDERTLDMVVRVLDKTRPRSHGGWVYLLGERLGGTREAALRAGSAAEMLCAAVDLVDDVEDGDAHGYLPDVPTSVQVNLSAHMWVLAALFTSEVDRIAGGEGACTSKTLALCSAMACGQHIELTCPCWSCETYERMTELTSARQLEVYFRLATHPSKTRVSSFLPLCSPLGMLIQLQCDEAQGDKRLCALADSEVLELRKRAEQSWRAAARGVPDAAKDVVRALSEVVNVQLES